MSLRTITKKSSVAIVLTGMLLAASVATAAWLATGTGTGAAKAISAQGLTVTNATATADLYPGFTNGDLFLTIQNDNPYQVTVTTIVPKPATAVTSTNGTCDTNGNAVSIDASTTVSIVVAGNGGTTTTTVPDIVNMGAGSDTNCQGATFSIPVNVTGTSS